MDGNGRWAKSRGFPRVEGHRRGADNVSKIVKIAVETGVKYLTLYSFSTENWRRPKEEVDALLMLIKRFLPREAKAFQKHNVRLETIGDITKFPQDVQKAISLSKELTVKCDGLVLVLALNYGGRDELVRAVGKVLKDNLEVNEININNALDTKNFPDPDVIVRTAGEHRLSNFLMWQSTYSELVFLDKTWPEFNEEDFKMAINYLEKKTKKFGGIK